MTFSGLALSREIFKFSLGHVESGTLTGTFMNIGSRGDRDIYMMQARLDLVAMHISCTVKVLVSRLHAR